MPSDLSSDVFAADLSAIRERNSVAGTHRTKGSSPVDTACTGILTPVERKQNDVDPGWIAEYDAEFIVETSQLALGAVSRGDKFIIADVTYQVMSFTTEPSGVSISYKLDSNAK